MPQNILLLEYLFTIDVQGGAFAEVLNLSVKSLFCKSTLRLTKKLKGGKLRAPQKLKKVFFLQFLKGSRKAFF